MIPQHSDFPRHADVAQAVGAVAGDLQIELQVITDGLCTFVIQPGHGEPLGQFVVRHVQGDVVFEPVPGD